MTRTRRPSDSTASSALQAYRRNTTSSLLVPSQTVNWRQATDAAGLPPRRDSVLRSATAGRRVVTDPAVHEEDLASDLRRARRSQEGHDHEVVNCLWPKKFETREAPATF
jgi:hypothetical protein